MNDVIDLVRAWDVLGRNFEDVAASIKKAPTLIEKVEAVDRALVDARKLAKQLMAQYHPDKLKGDAQVFIRVQCALKSIEHHTEKFKIQVQEILLRAESRKKDGFIEFK